MNKYFEYRPEFSQYTDHAKDFSLETFWPLLPFERREDSPRFEAWFSQDGTSYTYGRGRGIRTYESHETLPLLRLLWLKVQNYIDCKFDGCFVNGYKDGNDQLGWHADDGPGIDNCRPIAVVTYGATRQIQLRPITDKLSYPIDKIELENGSLLLMYPGCQKTHQHRIPHPGRICGPRVSFTFRGLTSGNPEHKIWTPRDPNNWGWDAQ